MYGRLNGRNSRLNNLQQLLQHDLLRLQLLASVNQILHQKVMQGIPVQILNVVQLPQSLANHGRQYRRPTSVIEYFRFR